MTAGPSSSGKPWPRLTAPVRSASAVISVKIVVAAGSPVVLTGATIRALTRVPRAAATLPRRVR